MGGDPNHLQSVRPGMILQVKAWDKDNLNYAFLARGCPCSQQQMKVCWTGDASPKTKNDLKM